MIVGAVDGKSATQILSQQTEDNTTQQQVNDYDNNRRLAALSFFCVTLFTSRFFF